MTFKPFIQIMWITIISSILFSLTSCYSNNDEPKDNTSAECVIVNGETLKPTTNCVYSHTYDYNGYAMTYFSAVLQSQKDGYLNFNFKCNSGFKEKDEISISIIGYHLWTDIIFSNYKELGGRIIVKKISENNITLSFDNYTFCRDGDDEFVINGTINFRKDGTVS